MGLPAPAQLPLFVSIGLIEPSFLASLLEKPVNGVPAELPGFALATLAAPATAGGSDDADPRFLVPSPEHAAPGLLYEGITAEDWLRLDAYQGVGEGLYERTHLEVVVEGERRLWAFVYLPCSKLLAGLAR